jgi:plasmid maintenance system antidote protein VapI
LKNPALQGKTFVNQKEISLSLLRTAILPCSSEQGITGDTAVHLAALFNTTAEFWMILQKPYELRLAERAALVQ